ncbi:hypothetical protein [Nocardioides sp. zg-1228]|uniref:hypothetical protein n=1 Tax=Nocardioides sp. zg-1228 TaxID=2763008 RepID=UPI0016429E22|nr:hypothetical protein [Nocardioides sp. zg-1228]MBC2932621.1 hypothetical protein [Nocardioides sp. zg-1228]QSF58110.1 hypothetical protein JX575_02505 [Nocardioides sp. zg-1228]
MPPTVRPRGPLPARVYWTRRLVVLGIPLVLVVVLARVLGGSSDAQDDAAGQATRASATASTTPAPTAGPTVAVGPGTKGRKGKKGKKGGKGTDGATTTEEVAPTEPVLAEPTGPCTESDIVATPAITSAAGGSDIPITLNLRTVVAEACTWQASPETVVVTITSGSDYIWSSRECPVSIPPQDVVVRQAVDAPVVVTWSARRSDEGCTKFTDWAVPGFYHVQAAALGGDATDVQFELTAPQPGVITKTAEPEKQGGKGKKNGDTSHTPGEDGAGNSAG